MAKSNSLPTPLESEEQQALFAWAEMMRFRHPELELLFHVPNGGYRGKAEAARFKSEGVKSGVPDICLPVARGGYHGLYVELKRIKGSRTSSEQERWIAALSQQGYAAAICRGWKIAAAVISSYLKEGHYCENKKPPR